MTPRRSVRAFLPTPVPRATVAGLLEEARRAPSGGNLQPGRFHALAGAALADLSAALRRAIADGRPQVSQYSYFPEPMPPELKARQRAAGYALYAALGIARRDLAGRRAQFDRNYDFFGAPVGIVVSIDRRHGKGGFMDLGMAIHALLDAAHRAGLHSCGIGALAHYGDLVASEIGLGAEEIVVCGIALGHGDMAHPVNGVRTERAPLDDYAVLRGFTDPASG
ncbi:nitroreductase [Profundibacterium mesophilum]|uniref:56-dimethylbenzimidazole synthase n=1 Tax=Profundibacterium mesophilum KAUST100406-0324 TaxID=1037889 RepID=A0A921NYP6_9RHOB|nr:nitroreductase [Profundibacterium mesophilum]KAF0675923.1 56-dimethylbenzimidazole synthase [Profundibacterium mesophilum KAUST100406-0324]